MRMLNAVGRWFKPPSRAVLHKAADKGELVYTPVESTRMIAYVLAFVTWVAKVGLVIALLMGVSVGVSYESARANDRKFSAGSADRQLGVCGQDQDQARKAIVNARKQAETFADQVTMGIPKTPELQDRIAKYVAAQEAAAGDTYKQRDCSASGLAAFYLNAPPPAPCPHGGDGKGYCK